MQRAAAIKVSSVSGDAISSIIRTLRGLPGWQVTRVSYQQSDPVKGLSWRFVDVVIEVDR